MNHASVSFQAAAPRVSLWIDKPVFIFNPSISNTVVHFYDVHALAPIREIPLQTLISLPFRLFITGIRQFFSDNLPDVFPHDQKPSYSFFRMKGPEEISCVLGGKFLSEWHLLYECNCEAPGSPWCKQTGADLFNKWATLLKESVPPGPFLIDLEEFVERKMRHCRNCVKASPLTVLLDACGFNKINPFTITEEQIQIRLPRNSKYQNPCFQYLIDEFCYPCKVVYY